MLAGGKSTLLKGVPQPDLWLQFADKGNGVLDTWTRRGNFPLTYARAGLASTRLANGLWKLDVAAATPRSMYSAAGVYLGYWAENAATNLLLRTDALDNAAWTVQPGAIAKDRVGPDGIANSAWTLTDNSAAVFQTLSQTATLTVAQYTFAFRIAKTVGAQATYPAVVVTTGANAAIVTIDTTNGVATVWSAYTGFTIFASTAVCRDYSPGWWSVEITFTGSVAVYATFVYPAITANPTQSTGVFDAALTGSCGACWPQVELGPQATTYVPSVAVAGTRAEDALLYTIAPTFPLTIYFEGLPGKLPAGTDYAQTFQWDDGTADNRLTNYARTSNAKYGQVVTVATAETVAIEDGTVDYVNVHKSAARFATNDTALFINGAQIGATDTSCSMPAGLTTLRVGSITALAAGYAYNGGRQNLAVWFGRAFPDHILQRLKATLGGFVLVAP
jgi:hypothetical protein